MDLDGIKEHGIQVLRYTVKTWAVAVSLRYSVTAWWERIALIGPISRYDAKK